MSSEIDHLQTDEIVCPHCGYEYDESAEFRADSGTLDCQGCRQRFTYERNIDITYRTAKPPADL